jgi:K(+)-stimulated pyrophosphate-energized sodium pump
VGRSAGVVVHEVRKQFREHPGIMDYTEKPDTAAVIDICTAASLRELTTPALLAVLTPAIVGFGISYLALGAFLAAVILTGQLMAVFLSNSGGAWDNAKKFIEDGNEGGKGSDSHKAAVIGDTVGDPFKDTAGPALNPLIKVMNLVSLLLLPVVISMRNNTGGRFAIAAVCLVVLIIAVAFSKRSTSALAGELPAIPFEETGDKDAPSDLIHADVAAGAHGLNRPDGPNGDVVVAIDLVMDRFGDDAVLIERLRVQRAHFEGPEGV